MGCKRVIVRVVLLFLPFLSLLAIFLFVAKVSNAAVSQTHSSSVTIGVSELSAPENFTINLRDDNRTVDLNWSNVTNALYYRIYYVDSYNNSFFDISIAQNATVTDTNWTDFNANTTRERYYKVASVNGALENLSDVILGKYDLHFIANGDGSLGRNYMSLPLNASLSANSFIKSLPQSISPVITQLDRSDSKVENFKPHTYTSGSFNNFTLTLDQGYLVFVDESYNMTVVGRAFTSNVTIPLIANLSDAGYVTGRNLIGLSYMTQTYSANSFVRSFNQSALPTITQLDRSDPDSENFKPHSYSSGSFNNFTLTVDLGYLVFVNSTQQFVSG